MAESADESVDRPTVIAVLRKHGVEVSFITGQKDTALLVKGEIIEVKILDNRVGRRMLHYLGRKFSVPVHHFWNPLMVPNSPGELPN